MHDNVTVAPEGGDQQAQFARRGAELAATLQRLATEAHGGTWEVRLAHTERVKSYAPRIFHVVFDMELRPK